MSFHLNDLIFTYLKYTYSSTAYSTSSENTSEITKIKTLERNKSITLLFSQIIESVAYVERLNKVSVQ